MFTAMRKRVHIMTYLPMKNSFYYDVILQVTLYNNILIDIFNLSLCIHMIIIIFLRSLDGSCC